MKGAATARPHTWPALARYGLALVAVGVAFAIRWVTDPHLGDRQSLVTFFGAVAVSAWIGGFGPTMLAMVVGYVLADWFFIEPRGSLSLTMTDANHVIGLGLFVVSSVLIGLMGRVKDRSRAAAVHAMRLAQQHQADLISEAVSRESAEKTIHKQNQDLQTNVEELQSIQEELRTQNDELIASRQLVEIERRRFQSLFEFAPQAYIVTDLQGLVREANSAAAKLLNFSHRALVGEPLTGFIQVECHQSIQDLLERVLRSGRVEDCEVRFQPLNRHWFDGIATVGVMKDARGDAMALQWSIHDVTERKQAEAHRLHLEAIIKNSDDAIISKTPDGIITSFNPGAERMYGYRADEVVGNHLSMLLPPDRLDEFPAIMERLRKGERIDHYETVRRRKDGSLFDVSVTISPIRDSSGQLIGASKVGREITEKRRISDALVRSEQQLRTITDSVPALISYIDADLRYQFNNRLYEEWFGLERGQIKGKHVSEVLGPEAYERLRPHFEAALAGRQISFEVLSPYRTGDRYIQANYIPDFDANGQVRGINVLVNDITQLKKAEELVRDSELRYRELTDTLQEESRSLETLNRIGATLAGELDLEKLVQTVTDAGTQLIGAAFGAFFYNVVNDAGESYTLYTISGVPRESFSKFPMPRNTDVFAPTFSGKGPVRSDDITLDPRYGKNTPYKGMPEGHLPVRSYLSVPVISRSGTVLGALFFGHPEAGVFTDRHEKMITGIASQAAIAIDNARLYSALRESEAQYRASFELAAVGQAQTDVVTGRFLRVNQRLCEITGYAADELLQLTFAQVTHPEDRQVNFAEWQRLVRGEVPDYMVEKRYVRKNGDIAWVSVASTIVRDEQMRPVRSLSVIQDITHRKGLESEIQMHREQLEDIVADRTDQLENSHQRLRLSERMAALGTLAAGLGHDMGNLLLPMRLRLDSIESRGLGAELREDVAAVRKCGEYLQRLSSGLRLFALDPDDARAVGESINLHQWWAEVSPFFRNSLPRSISLEHDFPDSVPLAHLSRAGLTQAIFNLVQNAGDALRGRENASIRVWARIGPSANTMHIGVSDNGPGMTAEVRKHCLEPFFTTKPRGISTGLGLALVHGIVQKAGGSIAVESEPGSGATFILTLPADSPARASAVQPSDRRNAVVSVADPRLRAICHSFFDMMNVQVRTDEAPHRDDTFWIAMLNSVTLRQAREFVGSGQRRHVILLGDPAESTNGSPLDPAITILPADTPPARLRNTLQQIASSSSGKEPERNPSTASSAVEAATSTGAAQ